MTIDADHETDDILEDSEHFNSLLDSLEHGEAIDDLGELSSLAQVSQELQNLPQFEMPASDRAVLRATMLSEFRKQHVNPVPQRRATVWYSSRSFMRLAVAACLILVFVFGGSGVLRISAASLPGDPFYGLKRFTEQVELAFSGTGARGDKLYELVQTRLTEIQTLVARGQTITEGIATDTVASLNAAIQAQSDPQKREQIIGQTAIVFSEAQTQGKLSQATVLIALGTLDIPPSEFFAAGATVRATPTVVSTASPTESVVGMPAVTNTMTVSATETNTATATDTILPSPTGMDTVAFTVTPSLTSTPTATYTLTPSPTMTLTPEPSRTPKPTNVKKPTKRPANTPRPTKDQSGKPDDAGGGKPENPGQQGGKK